MSFMPGLKHSGISGHLIHSQYEPRAEECLVLSQNSEVGLLDIQCLADSDFPVTSQRQYFQSSEIAFVKADILCHVSFSFGDCRVRII